MAIRADTHVFGSRRGYECLSKSPGVTPGEDATLSQFGFGQSSDERFLEGLATSATALGRPLPSGRYAITRVIRGPMDDGGRPTLERRTIIVSAGDYLKLRHDLAGLVDDQAIWASAAFADGRALSMSAPPAAFHAATSRDWQLFDAWVLALEQSKAVIAGKDAQSARDVLALAGRVAEADALEFRWGIRLLAPIAWVDMLTLSPYGAIDGRRQVHGVTNGPCVHPDVSAAQQRRPDRLPSRSAFQPEAEARGLNGYDLEPEGSDDSDPVESPRIPNETRRKRRAWLQIALPIAMLAIVVACATVVAVVLVRTRSAPTGTQASKGESHEHIRVSWDRVSGAMGYKLFRAQGNGMASEITGTIGPDTVEYLDSEAMPGLGYTYAVKALTRLGDSDAGTPADGWRAPPPPKGISATDGEDTEYVRVTWGKVEGASGYDLIRRGGVPAGEMKFRVEDPSDVKFDDITASPGTPYTYSVLAITPMGVGREGKGDTGWRGVPPPSNVRVAEGDSSSPGCIELRWDPVAEATGYVISRSEGTGHPDTFWEVAADPTIYQDRTAKPGPTYYYTVRAKVIAGEGKPSDRISGERALEVPKNLRATEGGLTKCVELHWSAVEGSTGYELLRAESKDGPMSRLEVLMSRTDTRWEDYKATPGTEYWYQVKALGLAAGSAASEPVRGWRDIVRPTFLGPPSGGSDGGPITLRWKPVPHATEYRVLRALTKDGEPEEQATVPATKSSDTIEWQDPSTAEGTDYWYRIEAKAAAGAWQKSEHVKLTRRKTVPAEVTTSTEQPAEAAPKKPNPGAGQAGARALAETRFADVRQAHECFRSAKDYTEEFKIAVFFQSNTLSMFAGRNKLNPVTELKAWVASPGTADAPKLKEVTDALDKSPQKPGNRKSLDWHQELTTRSKTLSEKLQRLSSSTREAAKKLRSAKTDPPGPAEGDREQLVREALVLALDLKAIEQLQPSQPWMKEFDTNLGALMEGRLPLAMDELQVLLRNPNVKRAQESETRVDSLRDSLTSLTKHFDTVKRWQEDARASSADQEPKTWVGWGIRIRDLCKGAQQAIYVDLEMSFLEKPKSGWTPAAVLDAALTSTMLKNTVDDADQELTEAIEFVKREIEGATSGAK